MYNNVSNKGVPGNMQLVLYSFNATCNKSFALFICTYSLNITTLTENTTNENFLFHGTGGQC